MCSMLTYGYMRTDRETEYMSFGLSGSDDTFSMLGADVVVADFLSDSMPRAVDYYLTAYSQVRLLPSLAAVIV